MRFSLTSAVICAIVVTAPAAVIAKSLNNFAASCGGFSLANGDILFATCENTAGTASQSTSINLNGCVANIAGTLECDVNGDYSASCSGCTLQENGPTLSCNCGSGTTLKNLNDCISNNNGSLSCP